MTNIIEKITELRHELHGLAEVSGMEVKTRKCLMDWINANTSLEIHECGDGFYAAHRENRGDESETIAIRADYDALATPEGGASHMCGHDGHAAALCGLALMLEGKTIGRDVILLFQPGEETGIGAAACCDIFQREHIDEIYGTHNLPGFAFGKVFTKEGTFACASRGLIIKLTGKPTHAAYPENGISPAHAVGRILCSLKEIGNPADYSGMTMCTVIGTSMGEKAFGAAAEKAEIWLTLRGEHDKDIEMIQSRILKCARAAAEEDRLEFGYSLEDVFPSTENTPDCARRILDVTDGEILKEPMRWSEDFGHYLHHVKGAFLGIGAGENYPPLHTECYEYPDTLLERTVEVMYQLAVD